MIHKTWKTWKRKKKKKLSYIEASKNWVFRLWTMGEIAQMLRIERTKLYEIKNETNLLVGMHRRVPYCKEGQIFYTDRQIFELILFLHPDIADIEKEYLEQQISEVPDNATFKERRKPNKRQKTKSERLALVHAAEAKRAEAKRKRERSKRNRAGEILRCKRAEKKSVWVPRTSGYTETYSPDRLPQPSPTCNSGADRSTGNPRHKRGLDKTESKSGTT